MKRLTMYLSMVLCLLWLGAVVAVGVDYSGGRASDLATNAVSTISYSHSQLHGGNAFTCTYAVTTGSSDDHRSAIGILTPNTAKWANMVATFSATDPADIIILENPTIVRGEGTDLTIFNRNRNSVTASTVLNHDASPEAAKVTSYTEAQSDGGWSAGTAIFTGLLGGGDGPFAAGGTSRVEKEWILDANQDYIFYIRNVGANTNTHVISLTWYEHQDKNASN